MRNAMKREIFPHVFAVFQLAFLILGVTFFADSPIATGGRADHALKVIMPFDLWILALSVILFALFYRIREEGNEEKLITAASLAAFMFSSFNLVLRFIDDLLLVGWVVGNVASAFYLTVPILGLYKMAIVLLLPRIRHPVSRSRSPKQDQDG